MKHLGGFFLSSIVNYLHENGGKSTFGDRQSRTLLILIDVDKLFGEEEILEQQKVGSQKRLCRWVAEPSLLKIGWIYKVTPRLHHVNPESFTNIVGLGNHYLSDFETT